MKVPIGATALAVVLAVASCSKQEAATQETTKGSPSTAKRSSLDAGPRAAASPVEEKLAEQGEELFKDKGCSACHAFGMRVTGPDLAGVSRRRTAKWIEQQILHPDEMVKEDPISRQLFAEFALQMPNQGLTEAQARAIVEFFKYRDHESADSD